MPATVVRYTTAPDRADENQGLIEQVFAELATNRPEGPVATAGSVVGVYGLPIAVGASETGAAS